jgi:putative hydrolase of the HAD superfamily
VAYRAVIFDLGGVVMPSPIDAFREYERTTGLPHRFISEVVVSGGDDGSWSRLERGELTLGAFAVEFEAECEAAGGTVRATDMMSFLAGRAEPRPAVLTAITRIRTEGLKTAALTNNWVSEDGRGMTSQASPLADVFDVVVESAIEGLRKPDPRIYELTCARLDVTPAEAVFLDDLGVNLKPARALGMATIKVADPDAALAELETTLGFPITNTAAR